MFYLFKLGCFPTVALSYLLLCLPTNAADRPDDIVAFVVRDNFGGQPGLYVGSKRSIGTIQGAGTIDLFCVSDSPGWAIIRLNGRLIAINGTGKTWARKGMDAFLRDGTSHRVAPAPEAFGMNFPDSYDAIKAALSPCRDQEAQGVEDTLDRLRNATARYPAGIGAFGPSK